MNCRIRLFFRCCSVGVRPLSRPDLRRERAFPRGLCEPMGSSRYFPPASFTFATMSVLDQLQDLVRLRDDELLVPAPLQLVEAAAEVVPRRDEQVRRFSLLQR